MRIRACEQIPREIVSTMNLTCEERSFRANNNLWAPKQFWKFMMRIKSVDRKRFRIEKDPSYIVFESEIFRKDFDYVWRLIETSTICGKMFSYSMLIFHCTS